MPRIFVQGDRDAKGIEKQVRELGTLCKERGIELGMGENGKIVRILTGSGVESWVHHAKHDADLSIVPGPNVHIVDCERPAHMATEYLRNVGNVLAKEGRIGWGVRIGTISSTANGFVFFPGREGTLAHLFYAAADIARRERDKEKPCRRVALVGWESEDSRSVLNLLGRGGRGIEFIGMFSLEQIPQALDWVAGGFPHEGC